MKQLPTSTFFLVADDIREEVGGKKSIMGLYVGGNIIVHDEGQQLGRLVLLAFFRGGQGVFAGSFEVVAPTEEILYHSDKPLKIEKLAEQKLIVMAHQFVPFRLAGFGSYKCKIKLDDQEYLFDFDITRSEHKPE